MTQQSDNRPFKVSRRLLRSHAGTHALKMPQAKSIGLRRFVWILQAIVVIAVIEHFCVRPYLKKHQTPSQTVVHGEAIPALGESAMLPAPLREATPSWLPRLDDYPQEVTGIVQAQLDAAMRHALPVEIVNSIGMRFRLVPPGDCMIGSPVDEPGHSVTEPQHKVSFLEPFYLGATEVTQAQWEEVMGRESNPSHFRGANLPVEEITWTQCQTFCQRLTERENLPKFSYRLPSEAEWEYACRAGSSAAYCFGQDAKLLGKWADYDDNNYKRTSPVGQKLPNALGLYDMHGNVWEWCRDYYKNYPGDFTPRSEAHTYRCVRGGNWYVSAQECRSANRCRLPDQSVGNMLGFRVMLVITRKND